MLKTSSPRSSKTPTTTPRRWKGGEHQVDHEEYNQDRKVLFLDEGPLHFYFLWHITGAYFVLLFFIRNTTRAYLLIQMSIFLCLRKVFFFILQLLVLCCHHAGTDHFSTSGNEIIFCALHHFLCCQIFIIADSCCNTIREVQLLVHV